MSGITFGEKIKIARKDKGYTQKNLAKLISIDYTYLCKLENNRAAYTPKEDVIRIIAKHLELNPEELIFLTGRLPSEYQEILKISYQALPALFRYIREQDKFISV